MIDPTDLKARINHYFEQSKGEPALDEKGERVMQKGVCVTNGGYPLTLAGLAAAMGMSREGLMAVKAESECGTLISEARSRVEAYAEEKLFETGSASGAKFALAHNFPGWEENESGETQPILLSDSELEERIRQLGGG